MHARLIRVVGLLLLCTASVLAVAQTPSPAEIETRMLELQRSVPSVLEQAGRRSGAESPRVNPKSLPSGSQGFDPAAIADQYRVAQQKLQRERQSERIMVFASLSMPAESLRKLARDAARAGVPLYFRGLRYGFGPGKTQAGVGELQPLVAAGVSVQIHPEAFRTYGVQAVPAVVVTSSAGGESCESGECRGSFARVAGDVSLDHALSTLVDRRDDIGAIARDALKRMQGKGGK